MSVASVPLDTMVPISRFGRGGASREFAKVADGIPVTVLRNNVPEFFIINAHDYREYLHAKNELENAEARRQAESGEVESFSSVADLMADLND